MRKTGSPGESSPPPRIRGEGLAEFEEAGNYERLFEEDLPLLREEGFDAKLAGTRLLGRGMTKISDLKTFLMIKEILDDETEEMSQYKLATDMIRETGMSDTRFDEILLQLEKLKRGFIEIDKNNFE